MQPNNSIELVSLSIFCLRPIYKNIGYIVLQHLQANFAALSIKIARLYHTAIFTYWAISKSF